jgi:membrane protease YdiL (CAAX protease family)
MEDASAESERPTVAVGSKRRALVELTTAYGLILIVVWIPRPWQKQLWWIAAAAIFYFISISFEGLNAMGLRAKNFLRALWVVGAAFLLATAAVLIAAWYHTLHVPAGPFLFIQTFWAYAIWAGAQQFLMLAFFLLRMLRLLPNAWSAVAATALIFSLAHLPNPILTPVTLIWGVISCQIFLRYRNLYPLAMAHAILGIAIAITVPGPAIHNMRVGLGYLTYGHSHRPAPSQQP